MTNESPACSGPLAISSSGSSSTPIARVMTLLPGQVFASSAVMAPFADQFLDLGVVARQLR